MIVLVWRHSNVLRSKTVDYTLKALVNFTGDLIHEIMWLTLAQARSALPRSTLRAPERDSVRSLANLDRIDHFLRRRINHRHRIVHDVGDKGASSIIADHDAMRAFSRLDGCKHAVVGCIYHRHGVVGIRFRTLIGDIDVTSIRRGEDLNRIASYRDGGDLLALCRVYHRDAVLISQRDVDTTTVRRESYLHGRFADLYARHLFGLVDVYDRYAVVVNVGDIDFAPVGTHPQTVREMAGLYFAENPFLRNVNNEDIVVFRVGRVSPLALGINDDMRGMTADLYIPRALNGNRLGVENQKPTALHLAGIVHRHL